MSTTMTQTRLATRFAYRNTFIKELSYVIKDKYVWPYVWPGYMLNSRGRVTETLNLRSREMRCTIIAYEFVYGTRRIDYSRHSYKLTLTSFDPYGYRNAVYHSMYGFEVENSYPPYSPRSRVVVERFRNPETMLDRFMSRERFPSDKRIGRVEISVTVRPSTHNDRPVYESGHVYSVDDDGALTLLHFAETSSPTSSSERHTGSSSSSVTPSSGSIPYEYTYHPPPIAKSQFGSTVQTGSRSLRSSNYTGPTHDKKLRDGILMMDVENTASSHPPTMVYAKNDPTKLLAPLSSWKQLPGQVHPTTRKKLGHSDLRKVKSVARKELKRRSTRIATQKARQK
jgi:hypothetical protein